MDTQLGPAVPFDLVVGAGAMWWDLQRVHKSGRFDRFVDGWLRRIPAGYFQPCAIEAIPAILRLKNACVVKRVRERDGLPLAAAPSVVGIVSRPPDAVGVLIGYSKAP
jgi:hypothetical protein